MPPKRQLALNLYKILSERFIGSQNNIPQDKLSKYGATF